MLRQEGMPIGESRAARKREGPDVGLSGGKGVLCGFCKACRNSISSPRSGAESGECPPSLPLAENGAPLLSLSRGELSAPRLAAFTQH